MNSTKFKVGDVFGDVINKDFISTEQITKLIFLNQSFVNIIFGIKIGLFQPKKKLY